MNEPTPDNSTMLTRWRRKFACAFRGLAVGVRGQSSFSIHFPATLAVVAVGAWLGISLVEWLLVVLCITLVISAELFNSALEQLAKAITKEQHPQIRDALDIASGAVLAASLGAAIVGCLVLLMPLLARILEH